MIAMKRVLTVGLVWAALGAQAGPVEDIMMKGGCVACHSVDKNMVGPSYKDIAAKYKGQDATAKLMEKVRKGGSGVFGPTPMAPTPATKINDADLKTVVEAILKS